MIPKYRGKSLDASGEWLYGSLINNAFYKNDGTPLCYILDTSKIDYDCWEDIADVIDDFEVDPATVGQWTGLQDAEGNDIYWRCPNEVKI